MQVNLGTLIVAVVFAPVSCRYAALKCITHKIAGSGSQYFRLIIELSLCVCGTTFGAT
jgi:hypothetical protein